jgi:NAD(P)-dependent dehydrogenase (short-subunit alcohol dehydrogenase family)
MREQPIDDAGLRGTVVNVGSVLADSPSPRHFGTVAYAASKGAIRSLTLAGAAAYAAERIRFNLLCPSLIDTPMAARAVQNSDIAIYLQTKQPIIGGPGRDLDIAEAALFLAEPATRFLTGVVLNADGGWSISEGQYGS